METDQRGDDLVAGDAGIYPELEAGGGTVDLKEGVGFQYTDCCLADGPSL